MHVRTRRSLHRIFQATGMPLHIFSSSSPRMTKPLLIADTCDPRAILAKQISTSAFNNVWPAQQRSSKCYSSRLLICSCKISDGAHKRRFVLSADDHRTYATLVRHTSLHHVTPSSPSHAPFVPLVLFLVMLYRLTDCQPRRIRHPFDGPETVLYTHF